MRLFAGFPLPPHVEQRLSALRLRLAVPADGLRWTTPEQWHLTLRFFGDVDRSQLPFLIETFHEFRSQQPNLRMEGLGLFPAKGILYAGIDLTDELTAFQAAFTEHIATGYPTSSSASLPFRPHITLARSKGNVGLKTLAALAQPTLPAFGPALQWSAAQLHLYESVLGPQGASYSILAVQTLSPPG